MMLPKPDCTFTIPSLHDGLELDGRLYFPRPSPARTEAPVKAFAIMAHPYAPLGGCWDDPIVQSVSHTMLQSGCIVNTFNFRGAAGSAGSTSWTANAELADYVSMLAHMLLFMNADGVMDHVQSQLLILGGYSYGSMVASCLPNILALRQYMGEHHEEYPMKEIASRAIEVSHTFLEIMQTDRYRSRRDRHSERPPTSPHAVVMGGHGPEPGTQQSHRECLRRSIDSGSIRRSIDRVKQKFSTNEPDQVEIKDLSQNHIEKKPRIAYLLISPILPPVSAFITMFSQPYFDCGQSKKSQPKHHQRENLSKSPAIILSGSQDMFTSSHKLKKWVQDIQSLPLSKITYKEIDGAGHFWREPGVEDCLQREITAWCSEMS